MQPHRSRAGGNTRRQIRPAWALASFNTLTCPTSVFYFLSFITAAAPPEPFFLKKKKKVTRTDRKKVSGLRKSTELNRRREKIGTVSVGVGD